MKDHILSEIRRLATANDGQAPGSKAFERDTGINNHQWRGKFWARWGDALVEAGLAPNPWQAKLDSSEILKGVASACRHYGRFPTLDEIQLYRQSNPALPSSPAIKRHFGKQADLIAALEKLTSSDEDYADIAPMLPAAPRGRQAATAASPKEGFVYLLKSGDHYKIGRGDDLERRVKQITIALPQKTDLVHSIRTDDPPGIEAYWHRRFVEKRANGEWFKLSSLDVAAFKKRKFQ